MPGVVPKLTAVAPVNPVPLTVTIVPPATTPLVGEIPVMVGVVTVVYVNWSAVDVALVATGVVTVTSTTPAAWAGERAVIWVSEFTVKDVPAVLPKLTAVAPVNPAPVIVTVVPPAKSPVVGEIPVTVGGIGAAVYVNAKTSEPPGPVIVATMAPAAWAGERAVIWVSEFTVKDVAEVTPNVTAVTPVKPVPVIITVVPPATGPVFGAAVDTAGAYPNRSFTEVALVPAGVVIVISTTPAA